MIEELEIKVNLPFEARLISHLYSDAQDLKLAFPKAKFPFYPKEWEEQFPSNSENCSLLFMLQNKVIGHTAILLSHEDLYLCYVILQKDLRRNGLAKKMILLSEEFCRLNYDHKDLFLNVGKENIFAQKLYQSLGYVIFDEFEGNDKMVKRLKR